MLSRTSPFRFVLTLFLMLAVPFCCCDVRSLLSGCGSCEVASLAAPKPTATSSHVDSDDGHTTHSRCHGHTSKGDDHDRSAPGNAPKKDQHDCSCGKTTGKMLTVEKSTFELSAPVVVAVLEWSGWSNFRAFDAFRGHHVEQRVVDRPATTLLRMHCALIV